MSRGIEQKVRISCQKDRRLLVYLTLKFSFFAAILYFLFTYIDNETYVFQSTSLALVIRPTSRKSCPVLSTGSTDTRWRYRHLRGDQENNFSDPHESKEIPESFTVYKPKIALLYIFGGKDGAWSLSLMDRVIKNRETYCKKHEYGLINANHLLDLSRPVAWSKLLAMEKYLEISNYDFIMYVDMDVVIMDMNRPLESFIAAGNNRDFIMTEDFNGVNTGVWLCKKSDFSRWFLRTAWSQAHLIQKTAANGKSHPFEYEQRAFHFMLNTRVWRERKLPKYQPRDANMTISDIRSHFAVLTQCAFNSYSMHPLEFRGNKEKSNYVPGDFLIHFAGKKGWKKVNLMEYYLKIAEATYS